MSARCTSPNGTSSGSALQTTPAVVSDNLRFQALGSGHLFSCGVKFTMAAAGSVHACALSTAGEAWCWGGGANGQLGNGTFTTSSPAPVAVSGGHVFTTLSVGYDVTCGITAQGELWCWGYNGTGMLGNGSTANANVPVKVDVP